MMPSVLSGVVAEMIEHQLGDGLGFARIVAPAAAIVNAVGNVMELHAKRRILEATPTGR